MAWCKHVDWREHDADATAAAERSLSSLSVFGFLLESLPGLLPIFKASSGKRLQVQKNCEDVVQMYVTLLNLF